MINEKSILGNYVSKEIEIKFRDGKWPFETLKDVEERKGFIFWWIVTKDGMIHLADDSSFMQTNAYEYFPDFLTDINHDLFIDDERYYGIFRKELNMGRNGWSFWMGFSLESIIQSKNRILMRNIIIFSLMTLILSVCLSFIIRRSTKPLTSLKEATEDVSNGDLEVSIEKVSSDEVGDLALSFNKMTAELKKSKRELQDYSDTLQKKVKERTKELEEKNEELSKFNKVAVGRELKMIELKEKIKELEKKLKSQS